METIEPDEELLRVRNTAGALTWNYAREYLNQGIGGNDGASRSQAELTSCMYIIAHLAEFENPD